MTLTSESALTASWHTPAHGPQLQAGLTQHVLRRPGPLDGSAKRKMLRFFLDSSQIDTYLF